MLGEFAFHNMQVGPADTAGSNPNQYLTGRGLGLRKLTDFQRTIGNAAGGVEKGGFQRNSFLNVL